MINFIGTVVLFKEVNSLFMPMRISYFVAHQYFVLKQDIKSNNLYLSISIDFPV